MNEPIPFVPGLILTHLSELSEEIFFAFHPEENKMLFLNPAFEKVWNISREVIGANLSKLIDTVHPDDRAHLATALITLQKDKQTQKLDFRIVLPEGELRWIRVSAYYYLFNNLNTIAGFAIDITADKEYSDTLHKFFDKKNSILEILSHDLVGSLGNIQASSQLLLERTNSQSDETIKRLIQVISESSARGVIMIRDFINREFLESSEVTLNKTRADIIQKTREIIEQYKLYQNLSGKKFELISSVNSLYVSIDESKFMQAINNLLSNALKFTGENGHITVTITGQRGTVLIKIEDNGIGIPEDLQPFLFDKFTKARRPGTSGEPTTGLGMSIVKTIVEWHHGLIWFDSTEGTGTTFYIKIPIEN